MTIEQLQKASDLAFKIQELDMFLSESKSNLIEIDWMRIGRLLNKETERKILQFALDEINREINESRDEFEKL